MKFLAGIVTCLVVLAAIGLAVMYTGAYNVAATEPHSAVGAWILHTTMENSVRSHAKGIEVPASFTEEQVREGSGHFSETCAMCHGAPGEKPGEVGRGLRPEPPELSEAAEELDPAQLFWIIKHGIKMSGMPAFGVVEKDDELWSIVAFLQKLPEMSPEEYQAMAKASGGEEHEAGEREGAESSERQGAPEQGAAPAGGSTEAGEAGETGGGEAGEAPATQQ